MDQQRVNLDGFAHEDVGLGLVAMDSPHDPEPSLVVRDGAVAEMDGRARRRLRLPRRDDRRPRHRPVGRRGGDGARRRRLRAAVRRPGRARAPRSSGWCPAPRRPSSPGSCRCCGPVELSMAMTKMRARRTPSNQAHVTNRLDDPLLLAADAATAAAYGFRELETTVPVLADAPSNAVAVTIGSAVGVRRACSCSARSRRRWSSRWASAAWCPTPRRSASTAPSRSSSTATTPPTARRSSRRATPAAASRCGCRPAPAPRC